MQPIRSLTDPRLDRRNAPTLTNWQVPQGPQSRAVGSNVEVACGWGRLIFAHTFADPAEVARSLAAESPGERDIALYLRDPHVVLSLAPHELFLDPSHTYRLWLDRYRSPRQEPLGFRIRRLAAESDIAAMNRIYASRNMVSADPARVWDGRHSKVLTYLVAEDVQTGDVIGTVTGVDHVEAFEDPERGSSLWCLAVDPQARHPGVGEALVRHLAEHFLTRGREYIDLSVMHDNTQAIALYEKLGFQRVPVFCVKRKNGINEKLFIAPAPEDALNPYARIIVDEARRRGIMVEVQDAEGGFFTLSFGGRTVNCRESLSDLTSAVAMSRCDDKRVTSRLLRKAGLNVAEQQPSRGGEADRAFLARHGRVVVKPARGEQGAGVAVDLRTAEEVAAAVERARRICTDVVLEQYVEGQDLRVIVIGDEVVAAAVRKPPVITGDGHHTVRQLIEKASRRRAAATGGESRIPIDAETERVVRSAGFELDSVLPPNEQLQVRKTANLHTGGTIHDVTSDLHPALIEASIQAARTLEIPVTGLDLLVPRVDGEAYVIVEANERPGLANHEPQPTAERFIDLLFPQTATRPLE